MILIIYDNLPQEVSYVFEQRFNGLGSKTDCKAIDLKRILYKNEIFKGGGFYPLTHIGFCAIKKLK
jgi:hypothetical protein